MKQLLFAFTCMIALIMASCGSDAPKGELEQWGVKILTQYPNYGRNDIATAAVKDSINALGESFVGKQASLFDGVTFKFKKFITNEQTGARSAVFDGSVISQIESNANGAKYVISTLSLNAIGIVTDEVAATLSEGAEYYLSGKVHAWDGEDLLYLKSSAISPSDMYLGVFIIDDLTITKIQK